MRVIDSNLLGNVTGGCHGGGCNGANCQQQAAAAASSYQYQIPPQQFASSASAASAASVVQPPQPRHASVNVSIQQTGYAGSGGAAGGTTYSS
jgi:hypothetical protein